MVRVLQHRENALDKVHLVRSTARVAVHEDRSVEHDEQNAHSESEHYHRATGGLSQ